MIDTIYLVKKNPNKPNSEDNWLMMSIAEYNEFVKTLALIGMLRSAIRQPHSSGERNSIAIIISSVWSARVDFKPFLCPR